MHLYLHNNCAFTKLNFFLSEIGEIGSRVTNRFWEVQQITVNK